MRKICCLLAILFFGLALMGFTACRESERVSYNISKRADSFNVIRRITVINCIKGDVLFVMEGKMSIDQANGQLSIIVEDDGSYKKHIIGLSDNVTYTLEDIDDNAVSPYRYNIWFNPQMWLPFTVEQID